MSAEVYIGDFLGSVAKFVGVLALAPTATAVAAGATALGVGAGALAGVYFTAVEAFKLAGEIGHGIKEAAELIKEDRELGKKMEEYYKNLVKSDEEKRKAFIEKVCTSFETCSLVDRKTATSIVESATSTDAKMAAADDLMSINAIITSVESSYSTLLEALDALDQDSSECVEEHRRIAKSLKGVTDVSKIIETLMSYRESIKVALESAKEKYISSANTETIRFDFSEITEFPVTMVFKDDISALLAENAKDDEVAFRLLSEAERIALKAEIALRYETLKSLPGYEKYAEQYEALIASMSSAIDYEGMSVEDIKQAIEVRENAMKAVIQMMEEEQAELFEAKSEYDRLYVLDAYLRKFFGLGEPSISFNAKAPSACIKALENEIEELNAKYAKYQQMKALSSKFKTAFAEKRYRAVKSEETMIKGAVVEKTYFVTPDKKNLLIMTVDSNGTFITDVVGVKVKGRRMDAHSIYKAQEHFCAFAKDIIKEITGLEEADGVVFEKPDYSQVYEIDASGILSRAELAKIEEAVKGGKKSGEAAEEAEE